MGYDREHRLDTELNRLLDDLARPATEAAVDVPGKRTRVEQLVDELSSQQRARHVSASPGRRTLVERLLSMASQLSFDDFRVLALRDVLRALGRKRKLQSATLDAADRDVARRAAATDRPRTSEVGAAADAGGSVVVHAGGQAMWRAAERRAATLYRRAFDAGEVLLEDLVVAEALARAGSGASLPASVVSAGKEVVAEVCKRWTTHKKAIQRGRSASTRRQNSVRDRPSLPQSASPEV